MRFSLFAATGDSAKPLADWLVEPRRSDSVKGGIPAPSCTKLWAMRIEISLDLWDNWMISPLEAGVVTW